MRMTSLYMVRYAGESLLLYIPMYLVSPVPFVTKEHIISDSSPTPDVFGLLLLGDVTESCGLAVLCAGVPACESCR